MESTPFDSLEFADNPEPRCPVVLLLDRSGSMKDEPINELNEGLRLFCETIKKDTLASLRVEVALITFGGVVRVVDVRSPDGGEIKPQEARADEAFVSASQLQPPTLTADGQTPMGEAVELGLKLLRQRKDIYRQNGVTYYRPWMFLITDGHPTDEGIWQQAAEHARQEEGRKGVIFWGVGVKDADLQTLARFSSINQPMRLHGLDFRELFQWLSNSLSAVAQTEPGGGVTQIALPPATWGSVDISAGE